jgi:hypothetical protein
MFRHTLGSATSACALGLALIASSPAPAAPLGSPNRPDLAAPVMPAQFLGGGAPVRGNVQMPNFQPRGSFQTRGQFQMRGFQPRAGLRTRGQFQMRGFQPRAGIRTRGQFQTRFNQRRFTPSQRAFQRGPNLRARAFAPGPGARPFNRDLRRHAVVRGGWWRPGRRFWAYSAVGASLVAFTLAPGWYWGSYYDECLRYIYPCPGCEPVLVDLCEPYWEY